MKQYTVLINLGTPNSTKIFDIQKYLFEFLMDPCVIDIPFIPRLLLVGGIIVPFRSPNTKKSYQTIWTEQGSPLLTISKEVVDKLSQKYRQANPQAPREVLLAMRYGDPSIKSVIKKIFEETRKDGIDFHIDFIPLYPQAALSTTETVRLEVEKQIKRLKKSSDRLSYQIVHSFYKDPDYLKVLAASMKEYLKQEHDHILFSYHGIPERHLTKGDPTASHCLKVKNCCEVENKKAHDFCYRHQVLTTTKLVAERLGLDKEKYSLSFQSRLGKDPWLTPYTDKTIIELAKRGVKKLLVACPAFVSDNLETLFEIAIENEELFIEHGGEKLTLIPCLNANDGWIDYLYKIPEKVSTKSY